MKEFKPKTRKQLYMAIRADKNYSIDDLPTKRIYLLSDYSIDSWTRTSSTEYMKRIEIDSDFAIIDENCKVLLDGKEIPLGVDEYSQGEAINDDGYKYIWYLELDLSKYILWIYARSEESLSNLPSVPCLATMYTDVSVVPEPKTNMEKYYAAHAYLPHAEDPIYTGPIPEPKTVDEYYTFLMSRSGPSAPVIGPANPGINDGGAQHGIA